MGLFDFITGPVGASAALIKYPALREAHMISRSYYDQMELKNVISEELHQELSGDLWKMLYSIVVSEDPVTACRIYLSDHLTLMAQGHVLILSPGSEDPTGINGTQGVTGELKANLLNIVENNKELKELAYGHAGNEDGMNYDDVWNLVLFKYWRDHWFANTFNAMRVLLKDCNPIDERDWFNPFLHALCVFAEDTYRIESGMEPAIPDDQTNLVPFQYCGFTGMVITGERFPDLAWREACQESIEDGTLKPPFPLNI